MHRPDRGSHGASRLTSVLLGAALVALGAARATAQAVPAGAPTPVITGVVRDTLGSTVAGVHVSAGATAHTITDSLGAFTLRGVVRGPVTLTVRRLGFAPLTSHVELGDAPLRVELRIRPIGQMLPAVQVRARTPAYERRLAGFYDRESKKLGYYITRAEIERKNDFSMVAALRRLPGVRVYLMRGALGTSVRLAGAQCDPVVFVDGFPASLGSFDLDMIDLSSVEGVEVYPHGSTVPTEFANSYGIEQCGVIAIWSVPARPRRRAERGDSVTDVGPLVERGAVYLPDAVDEQARYYAGSAQPTYPDSLFRAGVPGRVVAQLVVDTAGNVEEGTVTILSMTDPAFAAAVRAVASNARFHPAKKGGQPVRELVSLPFDFDPKAPAPGPAPDGGTLAPPPGRTP